MRSLGSRSRSSAAQRIDSAPIPICIRADVGLGTSGAPNDGGTLHRGHVKGADLTYGSCRSLGQLPQRAYHASCRRFLSEVLMTGAPSQALLRTAERGLPPAALRRDSGLRFDRAELAGALADLGVLVPIAVALIVTNGLFATAVLLPAGLLYVMAGFLYRLPVPVQPLKAFGAIAIAQGLGPPEIAAGGDRGG